MSEAELVSPRAGRGAAHHEDYSAMNTTGAEAVVYGDKSKPKSNVNTITIDEAIHRLGTGHFQHLIFIAVGLCMGADAMEVTLLSFLSAVLKSEWDLTSTQAASVTASVFAGQIIGTLVLGPLGDRIGRRPVFLLTGSIISIFGLLTAFAWNVASLIVIRALVGFGVGGLVVPYDILAEFLPVERRGVFLLCVEYFWTGGSLLVTLCAYISFGASAGDEDGTYSWVLFVLLCALPCIVAVVFALYCVPESPRWLLAEGRKEEAMEVLRKASLSNGMDPDVVFPQGVELEDNIEEENSNFCELLKPKWRLVTLLLWVVWFGMAFGYYGTILTVTRVFQQDDISDDGNGNPTFNYGSIAIAASAEIVGLTMVVLSVDRVGRIWPQTANFFMGGLFILILSFAEKGERSVAVNTLIAFGARSVEMGASCLLWVTTAEVLVTEIRTTGHAAANGVGRIGGFLCPFLIEADISLSTVGITMFFLHMVTALCASRLPETKGLELGEIPHGSSAVLRRKRAQQQHDGYVLDSSEPPEKENRINPVV